MPGPGGGGHGGGGGRGGFSGGSHGGGFGGGRPGGGFYGGQPGGGFHGPHMGGGWYFGPRRYRGGGGCCGGFMGMLALPLFIIFLIIYLLIPSEGVNLADGYNEEQFQDYANSQYAAEFGSSSAYEDNLLLTVLVEDENYYNYYYIAWIGDHIETDINYMMGDNNTELGWILENCINDSSYKYSLDSNLAQAVKSMTEQVAALGLDSSFYCDEDHIQVKSHLTNHSSVEMTEETVNAALTAFTEKTGIPIVIVVEDMDDVFGKTVSSGGLNVGAIVVIAAVIIAVVAIVITIRKQKNTSAEYGKNQKDSRYHDFDDQY